MIIRLLIVVSVAALSAVPAQAQNNTRRGVGVGGITGAVIGSVIGNQNDETAEGALIGGAVGAIAGGMVGHSRDINQQRAWQYHQAQQQFAYARASSLSDVVTMSRNGLSDQVIVNHIRQRGIQHELTVHDIVSLHQQGVNETVISAMQQTVGPAAAVAAVPVIPTVRPAPTVVVRPYYHVTRPYVARGPCPPNRPHAHARW